MSLYTAETRRLTKRRFTRFFLIGVVLVLGAIAAGMFLTNHKNTPEVVAAAQAKADREFQQAVVQADAERKACEAQAQPGNDCSQMWTPTREEFQAQWYMPPTFNFRKNFGDMVTTLAAILAMAAFVIGASFVGAEWNSGGMMNLLLWRPQRLKVLNTKLAALLAVLTVVTVLLSAVWTGAFALVASLRGTFGGMTSGAWQSILLMELRGLVIVLAAGALGFGLASIGRHTAVAMGVAIGVVVVLQAGLGTVLAMAQVKYLEMYLAPTWIAAWMNKSVELVDYNAPCVGAGSTCEQPTLTLTWGMAGTRLVAVLVLVVGTAMWTLRKRDIT
ncbi:ABC transporter permease [Couchioplanes caeruleus]|uniref:ABC transporter permease n=1 Tax=Couchioplanes caeruleus TaxID=56438 RepID=UPI0020BFA7FB|nr:ABC transporter permease subunit [Couchioplanes caeruleus]UQU65338.1 ABC transporter permease [Couchioplanes caeruleus]